MKIYSINYCITEIKKKLYFRGNMHAYTHTHIHTHTLMVEL